MRIGTSRVSPIEGAGDGTHRKIFISLSTGISGTVLVSILGAVAIRAMTTRLGAEAFGIFVLVQAFVSLVQTFTDLGLAQVLQRDIARGDQDERMLLSHAMGLRVTLGLIVIPVAGAIGLFVYANKSMTLKVGLVLMLCSIPFSVAQQVSAAHFSAMLRNTILAVGAVVQQVLFVGLVIVSVSFHKSVAYCFGALLVSTIVVATFTIIMARREVAFSPAFDRVMWYSMLRTSSPIGLAYIIGLLYLKADTLILGFLSTARQIGFYGVAYSIIAVFLVLPSLLTRTFLPLMVKASEETIGESVRSALAYFAIGGTFGATAIMVCAPTVIKIVAGPNFGASILPSRVLGLGLIFIFVSTGLSSVCIARGFPNKLFVLSLISLILNVALNIIAIPAFGINGAAAATLACEIVAMTLFSRVVRKEIKVRPQVIRVLARPLAAGLVTCAALAPIYLRSDLKVTGGLALIPALSILYFVTLALLGGLPSELVGYARSSLFRKDRRL
jgi:O-antigen/teichoic acid export membrane protein